MLHQGSCHCGRIAFEVEADIVEVMECNCSHCSRKGYLLKFVPRETVTVTADPGDVGRYFFNRHVIEHTFCTTCGCAPLGFGKSSDGADTAAINVRCVTTVDLSTLTRIPVDGRSF